MESKSLNITITGNQVAEFLAKLASSEDHDLINSFQHLTMKTSFNLANVKYLVTKCNKANLFVS